MCYGLLAGNIIDIDHIFPRIMGKVPWFESACENGLFTQCSFDHYMFHNMATASTLFCFMPCRLFL